MISYESSKWHIKIWRHRWYLYAIYILFKETLSPYLIVDFLIKKKLEREYRKLIKRNWKTIKRHVELSKMYKFSSKYYRED